MEVTAQHGPVSCLAQFPHHPHATSAAEVNLAGLGAQLGVPRRGLSLRLDFATTCEGGRGTCNSQTSPLGALFL